MTVPDPAYLPFVPGLAASAPPGDGDLWFIFHGNRMLFRRDAGGGITVPRFPDVADLRPRLENTVYFGRYEERGCHCAALAGETAPPDDGRFELLDLRAAMGRIGDECAQICGTAFQIVGWDRNHRFCGRCGTPTERSTTDRARVCPACGQRHYPRLSPAIIVAVVRDGRLLLARNRNFKAGFHSVLAGFVEPGESFEQCVKREVYEEAGIQVADIRYFGSQPWPFPDSLMVAFTATHAAGEIRVDGEEIESAGWYTPATFPPLPPPGSISRRLIDWYCQTVAGS